MNPPKLHGLITIDSSNDTFIITATSGTESGTPRAITLVQGDYFIRGYTGETHASWPAASSTATGGLVEHIQAQVRAAAGTAFDSFFCSVSDSGFVTLNAAESFTMGGEWGTGSSDLRLILGHTALAFAAGGVVGPNQHRSAWYPDVELNNLSGHPLARSPYESDARVTVAPNGLGTTTRYNERQRRAFSLSMVGDEFVFPVGVPLVTNRDYEQFFRDILAVGRRFRMYPDRTVQYGPSGSDTPETFFALQDTAQDGTLRGVVPEAVGWARLWAVQLDCRPYV